MTELFHPIAQIIHERLNIGPWQEALPYAAQVVILAIVWDLGAYWTHRWAHEWSWLWRIHALHHDQTNLHAINASRVHFLDTPKTEVLAIPLVLLIGVPKSVIVWHLALFALFGILSHTNLDMRLGVFRYVFNCPQAHRYHHSTIREEQCSNYGQIFMIWDVLFGTFTKGTNAGPKELGSADVMPPGLLGQLLAPFRWPG